MEPINIIQNVPKPLSPTENDIIPSAKPINAIAPEANPLTPSIKFIEFDHNDVVRHPLVSKIIRAYQKKSIDDKN